MPPTNHDDFDLLPGGDSGSDQQRKFVVIALLSLLIAVFTTALVRYESSQLLLADVREEAETLLAYTDSFITTYSEITGAASHTLPVPASFRARAIQRFSDQQATTARFSVSMVGLPGREIATVARNDELRGQLLALSASGSHSASTHLIENDRSSTIRSVFPSVASKEACVACHNRLRPGISWQQGDMMGALVFEREVSAELQWFGIGSVMFGVLCGGLAASALLLLSRVKQLRRRSQTLIRLSETDPLTACLNRRALDRLAGATFSRHADKGCVLALDLDHFKSINDTHGHDAGDQVLKHFAETVRSELRTDDLFARTGGEEFVVCLPGADVATGRKIGERIRTRVADGLVSLDGDTLSVTVSAGLVFSVPQTGFDLSEWVEMADRLLYVAKRAGRNRVVFQETV